MAEEKLITLREYSDIAIKKCTEGFLVVGGKFGGDDKRAFSTVESLIEWLSRELGAGPIVWALTLDIWGEKVRVRPEDLLSVPDQMTDPGGYQKAVGDNARLILTRFVQMMREEEKPEPPPEPKPKKEKKAKDKKTMVVGMDSESKLFEIGEIEEEKPKEEVKEE